MNQKVKEKVNLYILHKYRRGDAFSMAIIELL